jgi:hypothetical protein
MSINIDNIFVDPLNCIIFFCTCLSFLLCLVVLYGLFKTRSKWMKRGNTYVVLTNILISVNALQSGYLAFVRARPLSYRTEDEQFCQFEGGRK